MGCWNADHFAAGSLAHLSGLMIDKNFDLLSLQETEKLGEVWDDFEVGHKHVLIKPAATNGVGFLMTGRIASAVVDQYVEHEFAVLLCNVEGARFVFLNVHLPDNKTLQDRGLSLQGILRRVHVILEEWWVKHHGWDHLVGMGDFNTVHPEDLCLSTCPAADPSKHRARAAQIAEFCGLWGIEWASSKSGVFRFGPEVASSHHTHVGKTTRVARVIDYMVCGSVAGRRLSLPYPVDHASSVSSDRFVLVGELRRQVGACYMKLKRFGKPLLRPLTDTSSINRFAALISERVDSADDVEDFGNCF